MHGGAGAKKGQNNSAMETSSVMNLNVVGASRGKLGLAKMGTVLLTMRISFQRRGRVEVEI